MLKLKAVGIRTPLAGQIADFAREAVRGVTQSWGWESPFHPFAGRLATENEWYVDVGDMA